MQPLEFYTDYRKFLADYYNFKRSTSKVFSYRSFCIKSGLKSPSIYREVVNGKRNLTPATTAAFIKGLGLSERDGRFFENLVLFNQAKNEETQKKYLAILRGLHYRKPQKLLPVHYYEYYEKWYNPVVRELAVVLDWKEDYSILAKSVNPQIKISEARESINLLLRLGLLRRDSKGKYTQTDADITTGPEVSSIAVRGMNREYARLGMEAIDRFPPSERDISSVIMAVPHSKLPDLKREIADFRKRIIGLIDSESEKADRFYSLVVELFPVGQPNDSQRSEK
ncbi:MAG: TIGR02147 family protein [Fibrobacter sp.]|jgi:uncharacterized protein (TIGR02147 family)|nr:TIGR02147 family protein [Fibrobacter sp.]HON10719.1 TIGR02147 family protein [Chitinispirillaceae bacterium]